MGLACINIAVNQDFTYAAWVQRIEARTGERVQHVAMTLKNQSVHNEVTCRRICSTADVNINEGVLSIETMMPVCPYFLLQLELSAGDLGGQPLALASGLPRDQRVAHPDARRTWRELSWQVRMKTGCFGKSAIGIAFTALNILLLVAFPAVLVIGALYSIGKRLWSRRR